VERVAGVLAEARAAGLEVRVESDLLVVRGPRLHESIARQLLSRTTKVLDQGASHETGGSLRLTWPSHPFVRTPTGPLLLSNRLERKPEVLELLANEEAELTWRVAAMRPQVSRRGPIPVLVARELSVIPGNCFSCGEPLAPKRTGRCALCVRAAQVVLRWIREGVEA
jgi:hypothetical protein